MITALDRQSLLDIAIQTSGSMEAAFALSAKNDRSISDALTSGLELETVDVSDRVVLTRIEAKHIKPATDVSMDDLHIAPYGGIDFMGIEIDFIVS